MKTPTKKFHLKTQRFILEIVSKFYNSYEVLFSQDINTAIYINATQIAKSFKTSKGNQKDVSEWLNSKSTKEYISELKKYTVTEKIGNGDLVVVIQGGNERNAQGTWIHKKLIILFARWLSVEFAIWCDVEIDSILTAPQTQLSEFQETLDFIDIFEKLSEKTKGKSNIELLKLDSFLTKSGKKSVLDIFNLDLKNSYFSVSELGEFSGKTGSEINQALVKVGFQISENGVWKLLENGKDFCFETQNSFSQLKWKFSVVEKI